MWTCVDKDLRPIDCPQGHPGGDVKPFYEVRGSGAAGLPWRTRCFPCRRLHCRPSVLPYAFLAC